jgi:hypothetical protein
MVKSWVCPRCLGDLGTFYIEEGDTMVTADKVVCPYCGFTLEGSVSECSEDFDNEGTAVSHDRWHK